MSAVNIRQDAEGHMGLVGADAGVGPFVFASFEYVAASVDKTFFVVPRAMRVVGITLRPTVVGSDGGAVTAEIRKLASTDAPTGGTLLHTATEFDLKGTAAVVQTATLSTTAGVLNLAAGDALAVNFGGTLTAATGVCTVAMTLM